MILAHDRTFIFFQPEFRHGRLELNIYTMTLFLDNTTTTDCRLQAIGIKIIQIDIAYMFPMRKE